MSKDTKLLWCYAVIACFGILGISAYSLYFVTLDEVYLYFIAIFIFIAFLFIFYATWIALKIEKFGSGRWDYR